MSPVHFCNILVVVTNCKIIDSHKASFKNGFGDFFSLCKRLKTFLLEIKTLDEFYSDSELLLTESLICRINERFNVGEQLLSSRAVKVHDDIAKRIVEIEQHQSLLKTHINVTFQKISSVLILIF